MENEIYPAPLGFSDFANAAASFYSSDTHQLGPWDVAHASPSQVMLWGLARGAVRKGVPPAFVEIGTQVGGSTRVLTHIAAEFGGRVISMELDPACGAEDSILAKDLRSFGRDKFWTFIAGPSQQTDVVEGADFLLLDGDHGYEATSSDMARHGRAVRPGGIIVLDDVHPRFPGKMRYVAERPSLGFIHIGPWAILKKKASHNKIL